MSDFDLRFKVALNTTHPIDLVFGSGDDSAENTVRLGASIGVPSLTAKVFALRDVYLTGAVPPPVLSAIVRPTTIVNLSVVVPQPSIATLILGQVDVELSAVVDAPSLHAIVAAVNSIYCSATIDPPFVAATVNYDNAVYRGLSTTFGQAWQPTDKVVRFCEHRSEKVDSKSLYVTSKTANCDKLERMSEIESQNGVSHKNGVASEWDVAIPISSLASSDFEVLDSFFTLTDSGWDVGVPILQSSNIDHGDLLRTPRMTSLSPWGITNQIGLVLDAFFNVAKVKSISSVGVWGSTKKPDYGRYVKPPPPTVEDGYKPPKGDAVTLIFKDKFTTDTHVLFGVKQYVPAKKVVPVKRAYAVINQFDLRVLSTDERIETFAFDMSIDMDSWTWGFNANIALTDLVKVLPSTPGVPVVINAIVNGENFHLLVEATRRNRSFLKETISISGRGMSATLSDPYSPSFTFTNGQSRTAQQLANDALMINGVSIGWSVDWQIEDWLVPAGAWSHQGTYMSAVTTIANAAGAFVQPDSTANVLRVLSRNKVKPWLLETSEADIELPSAVVDVESITWEDRAKYDSVYVSGTTSDGVLGLVRRTGSAGDKPAPMVTDALITNAIAARQRGIYELSRYGSIVKRDLSIPVLSETGIVMPGAIVKYTDNGISNTGVVNAVRVNVALPSIRQQISITSYE